MADNAVALESESYQYYAPKWRMIDTLVAGTDAMRKAGKKYLPIEPREGEDKYVIRLSRSVLYNGTGDAIRRVVSKPFSRPMVLSEEDLPEKLEYIASSEEPSGFRFHEFARRLFRCAVKYGVAHVWVDYPRLSGMETVADEKRLAIRPIFHVVSPLCVIGWQCAVAPNGETYASQIRMREYHEVPKNDGYGTETVEHIRVLNASGIYELWKKEQGKEDAYVLIESGETNYPDQRIPWITLYLNSDDDYTFFGAIPPFEDLAWINIAHWQSMSDQRNILRFARVGILFAKGLTDEEMSANQTIGPNTVFSTRNADADLRYVEHTGAAIGAGADDLRGLEEKMEILGMRPFVSRSGNETATGKSIDEANIQSDAQAWVMALEDALGDAVRVAGKWVGQEVPPDYKPKVSSDFGLSIREAQHLQALLGLRQNRDLSRSTLLKEMQRRGVLSDLISVEDELAAIDEEKPDMAILGGNLPDDDADDDSDTKKRSDNTGDIDNRNAEDGKY